LVNEETAIITIASFGIVGLVFRNLILDKIAIGYSQRKYATINGFKQQEN
jgi:hypothetical protein